LLPSIYLNLDITRFAYNQFIKMMSNLFRILFYLLVSSVAGVIIFVLAFIIACYVVPPYTKEGYGLMPTGQMFIAGILSIISALWLLSMMLKSHFKLR